MRGHRAPGSECGPWTLGGEVGRATLSGCLRESLGWGTGGLPCAGVSRPSLPEDLQCLGGSHRCGCWLGEPGTLAGSRRGPAAWRWPPISLGSPLPWLRVELPEPTGPMVQPWTSELLPARTQSGVSVTAGSPSQAFTRLPPPAFLLEAPWVLPPRLAGAAPHASPGSRCCCPSLPCTEPRGLPVAGL